MNTKLVIVADLGLLRAYRKCQGENDRTPHLELIAELRPEPAHEKPSDQVTDQPGRFPRGSGAASITGTQSAGEAHHQEAEHDHRLIEVLAGKIDRLLQDVEVKQCALAVSAPIYKQLLAALTPDARSKIGQMLASNLARTDPGELLSHFKP